MSLKSNSFVAAAEQVCLQPVPEHRQRRGWPFHTFAPATGKARNNSVAFWRHCVYSYININNLCKLHEYVFKQHSR